MQCLNPFDPGAVYVQYESQWMKLEIIIWRNTLCAWHVQALTDLQRLSLSWVLPQADLLSLWFPPKIRDRLLHWLSMLLLLSVLTWSAVKFPIHAQHWRSAVFGMIASAIDRSIMHPAGRAAPIRGSQSHVLQNEFVFDGARVDWFVGAMENVSSFIVLLEYFNRIICLFCKHSFQILCKFCASARRGLFC